MVHAHEVRAAKQMSFDLEIQHTCRRNQTVQRATQDQLMVKNKVTKGNDKLFHG